MKQRIVVIGSINQDLILQLPTLPSVGETVGSGRLSRAGGGKGANQAVAAARAGGQVSFVGAVGDDAAGREALEGFLSDGIDTSGIVVLPEVPTGTAVILLDAEGRNSIAVASGSNGEVRATDVWNQQDRISGASWLLLQMELPLDATCAALEIASKHGVSTLFNYAPATNCDLEISAAMTGLVVNESEGAQLAGFNALNAENAGEAARRLRERGPKFVIITLGAQGVVWADDLGTHFLPAYEVNVLDTTAAGDVFCGALSVALGEKRALREAIIFAQKASAIAVTRLGAAPSIPNRAQIEQFDMAQHG